MERIRIPHTADGCGDTAVETGIQRDQLLWVEIEKLAVVMIITAQQVMNPLAYQLHLDVFTEAS